MLPKGPYGLKKMEDKNILKDLQLSKVWGGMEAEALLVQCSSAWDEMPKASTLGVKRAEAEG